MDPMWAPISIKPFPGKHSLVTKYVANWSLASVPMFSGERYAARTNSSASRAVSASRPKVVSTHFVFINDRIIGASQDIELQTVSQPFGWMKWAASIGASISNVAISHDFKASPNNNPQIEPYVPIIDIPKVQIYSLLHQIKLRGSPTETIDLRPPGNSGFDVMAEGVF